MTCLACGLPTALDALQSPHPLAPLLCVGHLVQALEADNGPLPGPGSQERVPRDRCWAERITCPFPATHQSLNARWCDRHAPPPHAVPPALPRTTDIPPDDGTADAVMAVLSVLDATILGVRPGYYGELDPLEGQ